MDLKEFRVVFEEFCSDFSKDPCTPIPPFFRTLQLANLSSDDVIWLFYFLISKFLIKPGSFKWCSFFDSFFNQAAEEVGKTRNDRRSSHISFALKGITNSPLESITVLSCHYIYSQIDYLLKLKSKAFDQNLKLHVNLPKSSDIDRDYTQGQYVSNISHCYHIYKNSLDTSSELRVFLDEMDSSYNGLMMCDGKKINNIGDRLLWMRNRALHGEVGDSSGEAKFVGAFYLMLFYF